MIVVACLEIFMSDAAWAALGAVMSAVIGGLIYALTNLKAKRIEAESMLKSLAVKMGIEEFTFAKEIAMQRGGKLSPPEYFVYVAYMGLKDTKSLSANKTKTIKEFWKRQKNAVDHFGEIINKES